MSIPAALTAAAAAAAAAVACVARPLLLLVMLLLLRVAALRLRLEPRLQRLPALERFRLHAQQPL